MATAMVHADQASPSGPASAAPPPQAPPSLPPPPPPLAALPLSEPVLPPLLCSVGGVPPHSLALEASPPPPLSLGCRWRQSRSQRAKGRLTHTSTLAPVSRPHCQEQKLVKPRATVSPSKAAQKATTSAT